MLDWLKGEASRTETDTDTALPGAGLLIMGPSGLLAGTHVASNLGWRTVEALSVGDKVLTFDNGMQPVTGIRRETLRIGERSADHPTTLPVLVPEGALHNRCDFWLMPEQGVLIESEETCDALGDPFAVVPAQALVGLRGIARRAPGQELEITVLSFDGDEVVYAEGGLLIHCPHLQDFVHDDPADTLPIYDVLDNARSRSLVRRLIATDGGRGLTYDPDEVASLA